MPINHPAGMTAYPGAVVALNHGNSITVTCGHGGTSMVVRIALVVHVNNRAKLLMAERLAWIAPAKTPSAELR
jgi:hypothetical protein